MMCLGMFMAVLDVQVVATSIPTIEEALDVAPDQVSWVQTAYLMAEVVAIPLTGPLIRCLGMRWLFVGAVSLFTLASAGCAASGCFRWLVAWRVLQGLAGGTLIPSVFASVFLLFPAPRQDIATTIAGVLAVLAPTVGPIIGGWITQTYSWHWLFLINLIPGLVSAALACRFLPADRVRLAEARHLDLLSLLLMALALATLVLALKEAPRQGWMSARVVILLAAAMVAMTCFGVRTWSAQRPVVDLTLLRSRWFAVGCGLSFVLGIGLFGSTYMMPVFLAAAHGYGALSIGKIMLVTGIAQLLTAPLAVQLEKRMDPRLLSAVGFLLFAVGLAGSARQTVRTDFADMVWPQAIRGAAVMLCLLPPTRMALGRLPPEKVPDASGLFNLMRNLGGAIGLAMIDTVIYGRAAGLGAAIVAKLRAGDELTALAVGIPLADFREHLGRPLSMALQDLVRPLVERLALVQAMNEAWAMAAAMTLAGVFSLLLVRRRE